MSGISERPLGEQSIAKLVRSAVDKLLPGRPPQAAKVRFRISVILAFGREEDFRVFLICSTRCPGWRTAVFGGIGRWVTAGGEISARGSQRGPGPCAGFACCRGDGTVSSV